MPDGTIEVIDRIIEKGDFPKERVCDRSQFINEASHRRIERWHTFIVILPF
ncbi:MAG: hypothetical protein ACYTXC_23260 [Nostoc sp.]